MRTNVVVKRLVYMATKTEEVLGLRKAALENDYTISDIKSTISGIMRGIEI